MNVVSRTDIGCVRQSNQDALLVHHGSFGLYGVADGMGGHRAGDVASSMTVLLLTRMLESEIPSEGTLLHALENVNFQVYEEQKSRQELEGMGTTITMIWEDQNRVLVGHVGDSRAYLIRDGKIRQVTQDHSMVGEMVREGILTPEEAKVHPYRNIITRAVGTEKTIECDIFEVEKKKGDLWLICSDGLYEYMHEEEMLDYLSSMPMEEAADQMLECALKSGGKDNVSLVLAEVTA